MDHFYSRPCGRGDDGKFHIPITQQEFLLTPLREGRRAVAVDGTDYLKTISTHAPAGGATCGLRVLCDHGHISTHAPAGGATRRSLTIPAFRLLFLLTPLREGRRDFELLSGSKYLTFLLTPLREGRLSRPDNTYRFRVHSRAGQAVL